MPDSFLSHDNPFECQAFRRRIDGPVGNHAGDPLVEPLKVIVDMAGHAPPHKVAVGRDKQSIVHVHDHIHSYRRH
jgi:hypothetical protein